jgi:hypothetical protein
MTTQTQQFIELLDVIALRCECRHCKAVLLIPIPGDINGALLKCPKCKNEWAGQEHVGTREPDVQRFVDSLRLLSELKLGCSLTLETKTTIPTTKA